MQNGNPAGTARAEPDRPFGRGSCSGESERGLNGVGGASSPSREDPADGRSWSPTSSGPCARSCAKTPERFLNKPRGLVDTTWYVGGRWARPFYRGRSDCGGSLPCRARPLVEWSGARLWDGSSAWLRPLSRARRVPLSSHRGAPAQPTSRRRPQRVGTRAAFASVASRTRSQSDCVSRCSANSPRPGNGPSGTTRDEVATSGEGRRWQSPWHRTSPVRRNSLCGRTSSATRETSLAGPAFGVLPDLPQGRMGVRRPGSSTRDRHRPLTGWVPTWMSPRRKLVAPP